MNTVKLTGLVWLAVLAVAVPTFSRAQERKEAPQAPRPESQPKAATTTVAVPTYQPPLRGAPGGRIGGGTRGSGREVFVLTVLAPDHSALTVSEQPSLFWFISSTTSLPIEVTVMDLRTTQPVLETRLAPPVAPGVQRIRLADHAVRLEPGVPYRWFVTIVPNSDRRSRDILAGGAIERVVPPEGLAARLAQARKDETAFLYAEAGVWYDALAAISDLVDGAPNDAVLRKQRATLLAQVGLPAVGDDGTGTSP
jgi:Domain of Unknown Function (DUF928)